MDLNESSAPAEKGTERSYIAFISYRHLPLDREAAVRIQKRIENYKVPKEFQDRTGGRKLGIVFRDEDELPASSSLSDSITYALDHSQFLIVICTPDLPQSRWCLQEIRYFLRTHDRDHILAVLADGAPEQSFPEDLRFTRDAEGQTLAEVEPLAANIAGPGRTIDNRAFKKEVVRLFAAMLGCPFDALWQRERRAKTNRLIAAMAAGLSVMAVVMGIVISKNAQITEQNTQIVEQNAQIIEQNTQIGEQLARISEQKGQIEQQNKDLQRQMSTVLTDRARMQFDSNLRIEALQSVMEAMNSRDPAIYDHRGEDLLTDLLGVYDYQTQRSTLVYEQNTDIERLVIAEDDSVLYTADAYGTVRAVEPGTGTLQWEHILGTDRTLRLYPVESKELVICKSGDRLCALSAADGSVVWEYVCVKPTPMQVLSGDKTLFVTLDCGKADSETPEPVLLFLDTATGEVVLRMTVPSDAESVRVPTDTTFLYHYGGAFSGDNTRFACALPTKANNEEAADRVTFFLADLTAESMVRLCCFTNSSDMILGMNINADDTAYAALTKSNLLYSVVIPFDTGIDPVVQNYDYSMSTTSGFAYYDYFLGERPYLPALFSDNLGLLFSRNQIFIMNLDTGTKRQSLDLDNPILYREWVDREEEMFQIVTGSGWNIRYDVSHYENQAISGFVGEQIHLSSLGAAALSKDGWFLNSEDGSVLAVPGDAANQLVLVRDHTNPDLRPFLDVSDPSFKAVRLSPSGSRLFAFFESGEEAMRIETYDAATGDPDQHIILPLGRFADTDDVVITDDSHIYYNGILYGMDGNSHKCAGEEPWYDHMDGTLLSDGSILMTRAENARKDGLYLFDVSVLYYRLQDTETDTDNTLENCIALSYDPAALPLFAVGGNGWLAGFGRSVTLDESRSALTADAPSLIVQDVRSGQKKELELPSEDSPVSLLAMANRQPLMACCTEDGAALLYDLETGSQTEISSAYAFGEIERMFFSDGDRWLLVYTTTNRLDFYDPATGALLFALEQPFPAGDNQIITEITAKEDPDEHRLIVTFDRYAGTNWAVVIDTDSWVRTAKAGRVCAWSVSGHSVFVQTDDCISICPAYTIRELLDLGEKEIGYDLPRGD